MSNTIVAVILNLLATLLPLLGIQIGSDSLTTTIQTIVAIGTGLFIWYKRYQKGDITKIGVRL
jgi:hypothetical protein